MYGSTNSLIRAKKCDEKPCKTNFLLAGSGRSGARRSCRFVFELVNFLADTTPMLSVQRDKMRSVSHMKGMDTRPCTIPPALRRRPPRPLDPYPPPVLDAVAPYPTPQKTGTPLPR